MAKYSILQSFYASERWQVFRLSLILERGLICEYCKERVARASELTGHHIIELTPENVHDVMISLNPANVQIVHHDCHNKIHSRFGYQMPKGIYLVCGPPLSGKSTYVKEHMSKGDLVVCIDRLYSAVSLMPEHDKPSELLSNVLNLQSVLIDNIKTRYGKWRSAWIIGGYADKYKRERVADDVGAEIILCDVTKEECIRRLATDESRRFRVPEYTEYINKWFSDYTA